MKEVREPFAYKYLDDEGSVIAEILFPKINDDTICITHTYVDDSLRGQGIAKKLVEKVIKIAEDEGYKITATCSYARSYFNKYPSDLYVVKRSI